MAYVSFPLKNFKGFWGWQHRVHTPSYGICQPDFFTSRPHLPLQLQPLSLSLPTWTFSTQFHLCSLLEIELYFSENCMCDGMPSIPASLPNFLLPFVQFLFTSQIPGEKYSLAWFETGVCLMFCHNILCVTIILITRISFVFLLTSLCQ